MSVATCVDIAVSRGVAVYPCGDAADDCRALAQNIGGVLAGSRGEVRFSLSPVTFLRAESGQRVVLPSPNGAVLSLQSGSVPTLAGCLRNASGAARAAMSFGSKIAVISAAGDTFQLASDRCEAMLSGSLSGRELIQRGYPDDVKLPAEGDVSSCAPLLKNEAFVDWNED